MGERPKSQKKKKKIKKLKVFHIFISLMDNSSDLLISPRKKETPLNYRELEICRSSSLF